jgi:uncharacterized protein (DUF924 family)
MDNVPHADRIDAVLHFWYGEIQETEDYRTQQSKRWFMGGADIDAEVSEHFAQDHARAASGAYDAWMATPHGCLALVLILDQFSRQLYRGQSQAFATDAKARGIVTHAVAKGLDGDLHAYERWFLYMPMMHSEDGRDQDRSIALFSQLAHDEPRLSGVVPFAMEHCETIKQFGRFPYRNEALGRVTTPSEQIYLDTRHAQ